VLASESMYMHTQVQMHAQIWLMQVNVYACIKFGCLSASKSGWCKPMYTHAQSTAVWALARVIDAGQCICLHKYDTCIHKYGWVYPHSAFVCMCLRVIHTDSRTPARWLSWWCFFMPAERHQCECRLVLYILNAQLHFDASVRCSNVSRMHACTFLIHTNLHVCPCCDAMFERQRE
jgi:hypothetical protein